MEKKPSIDKRIQIPEAGYQQFLREARETGVLEIPSQLDRVAYTHHDDWVGLKADAATEAHWFQTVGGVHRDQRFGVLLQKVFIALPRLWP
ncbi:hypothetical protein [Luteolibacter sp. LG18]|uniref:hypothetical protein n=1 Tax=Luteolibacter sp. LG18 TaxID=2819286 RepID=UPI002B2B62B6|nr:hypothetical protein llg_27260 [Luteolibacter sp. LG18]